MPTPPGDEEHCQHHRKHVNQATLLVAEAKVLTTEIAILAANKLLSCRVRVLLYLNSTLTVTGAMPVPTLCMTLCVGNITLLVTIISMGFSHLVMHGAKLKKNKIRRITMTTAQIELEELSVGADYEKVANRFRPILKNCTRCNSTEKSESCLLSRFSG